MVRIARLDFTSEGRMFSVTRALDRQDSALRKWSIVGPFPYEGSKDISSQRYGPEKGAIDLADSYSTAHGEPVVWRSAACGDDGTVNLRALLNYDDRIAYGATFLESDREQQVTFKVRSDDGVEIWLNGRKIHSHDVTRSLDMGPDIVEATLRKGVNSLLVKVANSILGWAFRVEMDGESAVTESDGREPSR